jgi:ATP-dependent Clp protease protease subunit
MPNDPSSQADSFQLQMVELLLRSGLYLPTSTYFIDGEVTSRMAGDLSKALHILEAVGEPITIHINTPGGDMGAGLAMYDRIRACKPKVTIIGEGEVMSMGACVLQAADHRLLSPNATVLIHTGCTSTGMGLPEDTLRIATAYKKTSDTVYSILAHHMKLSRKDMLEKFRYDTFLTARQAVKLGLADGII